MHFNSYSKRIKFAIHNFVPMLVKAYDLSLEMKFMQIAEVRSKFIEV